MESSKKLNFFPANHGISKHYSPRMIVHKENIDFDTHCVYTIGEYVQGEHEPDRSNTNAPRTLDCLYLRPSSTSNKGYDLLHLQTNKVVNCRKIWSMPVTPSVIQQVHTLARMDNMPKGLKITNKTGLVLYDASKTAGVDYVQDTDDDVIESPQSETESDDNNSISSENSNETNEITDLEEVTEALGNNRVTFDIPTTSEEDITHDDVDIGTNEDDQENNGTPVINDNISSEENNNDQENNISITNANDQENTTTNRVRPKRSVKPIQRLYPMVAHTTNGKKPNKRTTKHLKGKKRNNHVCDNNIANVFAHVIEHYSNTGEDKARIIQLAQQLSLNKGLKKFGNKGRDAAYKELHQIHNRIVFKPVDVNSLTTEERKKAMESLMFLTEKRDGSIKGRTCANGSTQRSYISKDEASSPTAATESILLTTAIEAKEERDVMTLDIPNAFLQTSLPKDETTDERIIMKLRGILVDILEEIAPEVYSKFVTYQNEKKVLYVSMLKPLYGMLKASLLYYLQFTSDIEKKLDTS